MIKNALVVLMFILMGVAFLAFFDTTSSRYVTELSPPKPTVHYYKSTYTIEHDYAKRLGISAAEHSGICSATAIAPHVILGATHCFVDKKTKIYNVSELKVDGVKVHVTGTMISDAADHSLLVTDTTFKSFATLGDAPAIGDDIYYWGNPGGSANRFRKGYVSYIDKYAFGYDINGFFGDSGAGVYNKKGQLIGVISDISPEMGVEHNAKGTITMITTIKFMESNGFCFSVEDLRSAGISVTDQSYKHLIGVAPPTDPLTATDAVHPE